MLTEWYPHAISNVSAKQLSDPIPALSGTGGELAWNSISISPDTAPQFPKEHLESRYYAARETSSTPVSVNTKTGTQQEKFLFYRGVASFRVPLTVTAMNDERVFVSNLFQAPIPQAILFERRGDTLGYRYLGVVRNSSVVEPPDLNSDLNKLTADLEKTLVEQGLFVDEAHAMVETWKDSWFEEGTRLLYVVPGSFVNSVLPLTINPAPARITRVFVGRIEVVTPATEKTIETAFESRDHATLAKYGRFLAPILQIMIARSPQDPARVKQLSAELNSAYRDLYASTQTAR
jgi:hypothetical protein